MDELKSIFSQRLRQARTMAKLSLREVEAKIGNLVSYNALSKYEKGEMMPRGEVLASIAGALQQPADFFFRPFRLQLSDVNFRKRVKLSASEEAAIIAKATDFFERYFEVEELIGCQIPFVPPLRHIGKVSKEEEAEEAAIKLREEWNLGGDPLPNIHEMLELKGIKLHEAKTRDEAFDGFSGETNGAPVVVVAAWLNDNLPRKRMTEAHELAHIVLPLEGGLSTKECEKLINRFAGAFLLPRDTFRTIFGENRHTISLGELIQIKAYFGVSIMAIMKRASQLGLINEAVYQRFWIIASKQGWRSKGEPGDDKYSGDETHCRFRQLVFRAVAEGVISSSKGAALLQVPLDEFRGEYRQLFA